MEDFLGALKLLGWWFIIFCSLNSLSARVEKMNFISTPNEKGSPTFHHHLVPPGSVTSYIIQVKNIWDKPMDIELKLNVSALSDWQARLETERVHLERGEVKEVLLEVKPGLGVAIGKTCEVEVVARAGDVVDRLEVIAETSKTRKIYFISIDSLHPGYLKLNSKGTGYGKEGDWLMPNLRYLLKHSVFYPNSQAHIITATDMNHFNFMAGTKTGTAGIPSVNVFFYGFDDRGRVIRKFPGEPGFEIGKYDRGKEVLTIFNVAKQVNPNSWGVLITGKNWIGNLYGDPKFKIDRIISGKSYPDFIPPYYKELSGGQIFLRALSAILPGPLPPFATPIVSPNAIEGRVDKRLHKDILIRIMDVLPREYPSDEWIMDSAIKEIMYEDPDICYILFGWVDDAGHGYGSAWDLDEWDDNGTPEDISDDISKYDPRASRQGIIEIVRNADRQVGKFIQFLKERGTWQDAIIIVESDHAMVTLFKKPISLKNYLKKHTKYSLKKDYFIITATSIGAILKKRDDPEMVRELERTLENMEVINPITGKKESPLIVYNREEMKTGIDQKTKKAWLLPYEYYSEYYIEHRKPKEQLWPDLLILGKPHYKFTVVNYALANVGLGNIPVKLPELGYYIGGHGSIATRPNLLMIKIPGIKPAVRKEVVYPMEVAPTLYRILGWTIPECVDGRGLPGIQAGF